MSKKPKKTNKDKKEVAKTEVKKEKEGKKNIVVKITTIVILAILAVFGIKEGVIWLLRQEKVETETVEVSEDARGFSGYFKEYLASRLAVENLFKFEFREKSREEILERLAEVKDGFSKVLRGIETYAESEEYKEVAEVIENDAEVMLATVRGARRVMTEEYADEADREADFMKVTSEGMESMRSEFYLAGGMYKEGEQGKISEEGIAIFKGVAVVEVGGGVMNVFVGDAERGFVTIDGEGYVEGAKAIRAEKAFLYTGARLVKFGTGVREEILAGKLVVMETEIKEGKAEITRRKMGVISETVMGVEEQLKEKGVEGALTADETGTSEILTETEEAVRGKKK